MGIKQTISHLMAGIICFAVGFWLGQSESTVQTVNETRKLEAQLEQLTTEKTALEESLASMQSLDVVAQNSRTGIDRTVNLENQPTTQDAQPMGAFQKLMLGNLEKSLRDMYDVMFTQMVMSEEEVEAFVREIVAHQAAVMDRSFEISGAFNNLEDLTDDEKQALMEKRRELRKSMDEVLEAKMRDHFGDDYDQYDAYNRTVDMRQRLRSFDKSFRDSLGEYAREEVILIMAEENELLNIPEWEYSFDEKENLRMQRERMSYTKEWEANVLDRTSAVLSSIQQEELATMLERERKEQELYLQAEELRAGVENEE